MTPGYDQRISAHRHPNTVMRPPFSLALALLAISLSCTAHAQVYKCKEDGSGKITYSGVPCHGRT
jgi:hypothetical protein